MNEHTDKDINIFLIKLEVWKIGDSQPAPKFHIIIQPNDWAKMMRSSGSANQLSSNQMFYFNFWTEFLEYGRNKDTTLNFSRKPTSGTWYNFPIGTSLCTIEISAVNRENLIRCCLYIRDSMDLFQYLQDRKDSIESQLGVLLEWSPLPNKKASLIRISKNADLHDENHRNESYDWYINSIEKFQKLFPKYISEFDSKE